MPGLGKSGTSRISFLRFSIRLRYSRKACSQIFVDLTKAFVNNAVMALRIWIAMSLIALAAYGQKPAARFEVASVKVAESGGPVGDIPRNMTNSPGHFEMRRVPVRYI